MIMNPAESGRLTEVISEGEFYGMETFDHALLGHMQQGKVDMEEALTAATSPHHFKRSWPRTASARPRSTSCSRRERPAARRLTQHRSGAKRRPAP